jgi:hypothetical protein
LFDNIRIISAVWSPTNGITGIKNNEKRILNQERAFLNIQHAVFLVGYNSAVAGCYILKTESIIPMARALMKR